ncbi:MAG: outer membrane protein transport protein [Rhodobiaceae bacterium]|nr:outer membrane protein transport protein [Rhodobiaceae bacterium]
MSPALLAASATVALLAGTLTAEAGGFAIREQSIYFQGMSFAGSAAGGQSPSSLFWNPSTITQHNGHAGEQNATVVAPRSTIDVDSATTPALGATLPALPITPADSSQVGHAALVPAGYTVLQLTDRFWVGMGINAPFGLGVDADGDYAGRYHGIEGHLATYDFNPVVGLKINDYVSLGAGAQIMYGTAKLTQRTRTATILGTTAVPFDATSELTGDGWGFGFTAGITVTPTPSTRIGLGYRSQVDLNLDGDVFLRDIAPLVAAPLPSRLNLVDIETTVNLPDVVTLSVTHDFSERFRGSATVEWTNWSRFKEIKIESKQASTALALPIAAGDTLQVVEQKFDDGWFFALGGEFDATEHLTFRAGAAYEISPVQDKYRTPRTPDADRIWLSAGATYRHNDRLAVDVAYTHIFIEDGDINLANYNQASNGGTGDQAALKATAVNQSVDIFGVSLRYKLGGSPIFAR